MQEQIEHVKEALQLEVIAREAAEGKAQRLHRSHAVLDSQLRVANESLARLTREARGRSSTGSASGTMTSRSPQAGTSRSSGGAASIIEDATQRLISGTGRR